MLWKSYYSSLVVLTLLAATGLGGTVTFMPELDADSSANTSSTASPYDSNVLEDNAPVGITVGSASSHSDTFYFRDATNGIAFSFDVTWLSTGGNLSPTATLLGVGDNSLIEGDTAESDAETLTIEVGNLSIDLAGYVSGSEDGITTPVLDSSSVAFDRIIFDSLTSTESINISAGLDEQLTFSTATGNSDSNFDVSSEGFSANEQSLTFSVGSADQDFSVSATRFNVVVQLSAAPVPEPSSFLFLGVLVAVSGGWTYRRRRFELRQE